jgi:sulfate permease, SulP family
MKRDAWLPTLITGTVIGFVTTIFAISLASLVFSGALAGDLSRGIGMVLATTSISSIVIGFLSSSTGVIAQIQESPIVVIVAAVSAISVPLADSPALLPTVLVLIAFITLSTGIVLVLIGTFKLSALVRYLPYPVMGGFLAGTGVLLLQGSIGIMADYPITVANLPILLGGEQLLLWLPGVLFGIAIFVGMRRIQHAMTFPAILISGVVIFYILIFVSGLSIEEATSRGFLLGDMGDSVGWQPFDFSLLGEADWGVILSQLGNISVIFLLVPISLLLNISGIELHVREDSDINQELRSVGFANMFSALAGGMVGFHAISMTILSHNMKARNRYTGIIVGIVPLLILFIGVDMLAYTPKLLIGGLLFYLGLSFAYEWIVEMRTSLAFIDWLVVLVIGITIVLTGFLTGIVLGLGIMVAMFLVSYSRTNIFRHVLSGAEMASHFERNTHHRRELIRLGEHTHIFELQGFIFFGTANAILDTLKARLQDDTVPLYYLILDFRHVTGIDSSAAFSFIKARFQAESEDFTIILTHL